MDDELDGVTEHMKERSTWLRIFFMVGFGLALYVVGFVLTFITLAQALFSVFTGTDNRNLRLLGADLSEYVNQILRYLTYNSQIRPFPFSPFPDQADVVEQQLQSETTDADGSGEPDRATAESSRQGTTPEPDDPDTGEMVKKKS
ncbi:MAG: DUF4389 domain-containing protein [Gammaproteobacteria bacterium]|nr:DUF4389 domain-containing protein [Pseudomonadales bacterium]MCP5346049.1 DUF4389 domain-containing protein [Pseudomonadales bacterium]